MRGARLSVSHAAFPARARSANASAATRREMIAAGRNRTLMVAWPMLWRLLDCAKPTDRLGKLRLAALLAAIAFQRSRNRADEGMLYQANRFGRGT